jgi:broad-like protein
MSAFQLAWKEFNSCTSSTFQDLYSDTEFTDVTLATDDDKQIKAHKVILSSCSSFFRRILLNNPHQHPLLYLKGINSAHLKSIIQFIYLGQAEVNQDDIQKFMESAKDLEIKGLTTT